MNIFDPQSKVLANFDYVSQFLETGYSPPILVEVDPANVCNHGCEFCLSSYVHAGKELLTEQALMGLCDDLIAIRTKAINWTGGGEPTVNKHLKKAIAHVGKANGVRMGMFTNGTLLDKHDLFETLVENMTWVRISVDAGGEESYNRIRKARSSCDWQKMISNLDKLIEANLLAGKPINIGVGFVVTPGNVYDILEFARRFKDMDIDYVQFKPEIVNLERHDGVQRKSAFWNMCIGVLIEARNILGPKFQINDYKLEDLEKHPEHYGREYRKCLGSQVSPCVGADGEVYVCTNHRGYKEFSYGSIYQKPFSEIWKDVERRRFVMSKIEDRDKFACCTQLCKPHESNKMMWKLYQEYWAAPNKSSWLNAKSEDCKSVSVQHPEFI